MNKYTLAIALTAGIITVADTVFAEPPTSNQVHCVAEGSEQPGTPGQLLVTYAVSGQSEAGLCVAARQSSPQFDWIAVDVRHYTAQNAQSKRGRDDN